MRTNLSAILLAFCISQASADSWTSGDKKLHFGLSIGISAVATGLYGQMPIDNPAMAGFGTCAAVGAVKEAMDANGSGDPSWKDFGADIAGCALGAWIGDSWLITPNRVVKTWRY